MNRKYYERFEHLMRDVFSDGAREGMSSVSEELLKQTRRSAELQAKLDLAEVKIRCLERDLESYRPRLIETKSATVTREELHADPKRVTDLALGGPVYIVDGDRVVLTVCRSVPPVDEEVDE